MLWCPGKMSAHIFLGSAQALLSIIGNADSINIKRDIKGFSKDLNNKQFYNSISYQAALS